MNHKYRLTNKELECGHNNNGNYYVARFGFVQSTIIQILYLGSEVSIKHFFKLKQHISKTFIDI